MRKLITTVLVGAIAVIVLAAAALLGIAATLFNSGGSTNCTPTDSATASHGYGPDQISNAAIIVAIGKQMNVPERGWVIALVTAIQESRLRNLDHGDRDSLGLFQQRPSQGWGADQVMNSTYSTTQFYRHLLAVPGWQKMTINDAAQAVQRSGFPHEYAQHEHAARQLLGSVHDAACTGTPSGNWTVPAQGQCTSGFGRRGSEFHRGQDIAAPIGTPILAASSGTVIDSGPARGYGLWIRIQHSNGVVTTYGHNNRNIVEKGQGVHTGQPVAEVGDRGESTGPHLHFQVEVDSQPVDPVTFFRQQSASPLCG
ncbi:M23 family metallopeptidase [Saccharopolyspora elongata]|uniref:M23 family metallopeptidase n=1 Tax=Saccharopolyspora elongata TaxID=2530387 RepID=A0A4V2YK53_9PSEU|nr:M23 family metallopeptidase [Saccharopolyspora elongata]TDD41397.1 M23 family metallopeptidase [Saccharopolyspora elongata]